MSYLENLKKFNNVILLENEKLKKAYKRLLKESNLDLDEDIDLDKLAEEEDEELKLTATGITEGKEDFIEVISSFLDDDELEVLKMRFGLEDGVSATLEEVGTKLGLPKERVRQKEVKAIRKLRFPSAMKAIAPFKQEFSKLFSVINNETITEEKTTDHESVETSAEDYEVAE
jgi:DNA-directed RNA polymerase sigma subunit (sigma70/sigma32)